MKKLLLVAVLAVIAVTSSGCETMKGAAKDIQNTGDNIWNLIKSK